MKILVAIPFKKNINGLRITLNSLLDGSTFDDLYILLSNNNSNEKIDLIVSEFKTKLHIIYKKHSKDLGRAGNLNYCLEFAKENDFEVIKYLFCGDEIIGNPWGFIKRVFQNEEISILQWTFIFKNDDLIKNIYPPLKDGIYSKDDLFNLGLYPSNIYGAIACLAFKVPSNSDIRFETDSLGIADFCNRLCELGKTQISNKIFSIFNKKYHSSSWQMYSNGVILEELYNRVRAFRRNFDFDLGITSDGKNLIKENFNTRNIVLYFLKSYVILIKQNLYKSIYRYSSKLSFLKRKFINFKKLIYQFFLSTLNNVLFFLPRTIIFGSRNCNTFKGSPRKMFEHLENYFYSNGKRYSIYWISEDVDVVRQIKALGRNVAKNNSLLGLIVKARAKIALYEVCTSDLGLLANKTLRFNLWHGTPIAGNNLILLNERTDFLSVSAEFMQKPNLPHTMTIDQNTKILLTGYPRNDLLNEPKTKFLIKNKEIDASRSIIYAPTWRFSNEYSNHVSLLNLFIDYNFLSSNLMELLAQRSLNFIFSPHDLSRRYNSEIRSLANLYNNFYILDPEEYSYDIYKIYAASAYIITDYSSLIFDMLSAKKNILFAPFDIKNYKRFSNKKNWKNDYLDIAKSRLCLNWIDVHNFIKDCANSDDNNYEKVRSYYNAFDDFKSTYRVENYIKKILNKEKL